MRAHLGQEPVVGVGTGEREFRILDRAGEQAGTERG
jgi:hypothetical protein